MKLNELRKEISDIDTQLIELLKKRFLISKRIGQYKSMHNLPVTDQLRENDILNKYKKSFSNKDYPYFKEIFGKILKTSKDIQNE